MTRHTAIAEALTALVLLGAAPVAAGPEPAALYAEHCAGCHGADRLGGTAPALIPETLARLAGAVAAVVATGRPATQMPGFAAVLDDAQITAVADWLAEPLEAPEWPAERIAGSLMRSEGYDPPSRPLFAADPLNLFVVVETGDHHLSILDGDRFRPLARLPTPPAVHGGPKFTPDGRFVFVMSRDGWVQKIDLWALREVARLRVGINSRNIAISADGQHLAVANSVPPTLAILSTGTLEVERVFEVADRDGAPSRVSAVYAAPPRDSFIVALKDVPEIWEVATDPAAPPVYEGLVHSHEAGQVEALATSKGLFALRRIAVAEPLDDFFFDPGYRHLIGAARATGRAVVVNLNVGREIADLPLAGMPHLGSGIAWRRQGRWVMAAPHLEEPRLTVIDLETWQGVATIETLGPGFFLRGHEQSRYLWADVFFGPHRDAVHVIDRESLQIVRTLRPQPGATAAHAEFDRDGSHVLVSLWEDDGAVVVYDAATLQETARLPMRKPSGKYNVWNKITLSPGTSH